MQLLEKCQKVGNIAIVFWQGQKIIWNLNKGEDASTLYRYYAANFPNLPIERLLLTQPMSHERPVQNFEMKLIKLPKFALKGEPIRNLILEKMPPLTVRPDFRIIDGVRRYEAAKLLGWIWIPCKVLGP